MRNMLRFGAIISCIPICRTCIPSPFSSHSLSLRVASPISPRSPALRQGGKQETKVSRTGRAQCAKNTRTQFGSLGKTCSERQKCCLWKGRRDVAHNL